MSEKHNLQFHFKGPPDQLDSKAVLGSPATGTKPLELEIKDRRHALQAQAIGDKSETLLRLKLPQQTPPGVIDGLVRIGKQTYPAKIEVQELHRVITEPRAVRVACVAGSRIAAKMQVTNAGNVSQDLEPEQTIPMRKADALSRGVQAAFKGTSADVTTRLITLGKRLSAEPVREVTFDLKADSHTLTAGDRRTVEISAQIPKDFDLSVNWTGHLSVFRRAVSVTLDISDQEGNK